MKITRREGLLGLLAAPFVAVCGQGPHAEEPPFNPQIFVDGDVLVRGRVRVEKIGGNAETGIYLVSRPGGE